MGQLNVLIDYTGCAAVTMVLIILMPLGAVTCIKNGNDFLGKTLTFLWVIGWLFATVFVYNAIFGG